MTKDRKNQFNFPTWLKTGMDLEQIYIQVIVY